MQVSGRRGKDDKSKLSEGNIERGCVLFLPASGESLFLFCLYLPRRQLQLQQARSCWQKGIRQRVTHPPWEPLAKRKQPSSLLPGSHAGQAPCGPRRWGLRVPPTPPPHQHQTALPDSQGERGHLSKNPWVHQREAH